MKNSQHIKIYFFGDSICFGQLVSPNQIWINLLSQKIDEKFRKKANFVIQNPSINGNTTRMALERMPYDIQSHSPDILHIQFGMNDCNIWATDAGHPRTSKSAFVENLKEIIERAYKCGTKKIILGVNHPTTRTTLNLPHSDKTYDSQNRYYNSLIREVAQSYNLLCVDNEKAFDEYVLEKNISLNELLLEDQLHLSIKGHEVYAQNYWRYLEEIILTFNTQ